MAIISRDTRPHSRDVVSVCEGTQVNGLAMTVDNDIATRRTIHKGGKAFMIEKLKKK